MIILHFALEIHETPTILMRRRLQNMKYTTYDLKCCKKNVKLLYQTSFMTSYDTVQRQNSVNYQKSPINGFVEVITIGIGILAIFRRTMLRFYFFLKSDIKLRHLLRSKASYSAKTPSNVYSSLINGYFVAENYRNRYIFHFQATKTLDFKF